MTSPYVAHRTFTLLKATCARASHRFAAPFRVALNRMLFSVMLLWWLAVPLCAQQPKRPDTRTLPTDAAMGFEIGGDEKHVYEVALPAAELLQIHVAQTDIDILLTLLDAGDRTVAQMRVPHRFRSEEILTFVASASGSYRLEVTALDAKAAPGKYTIRRESPRAATARDRRRVEVERIFFEALTARATAGQVPLAITKFTESSAGWQELADDSMMDLTKRLVTEAKAFAAFTAGKAAVAKEPREALKRFEEARDLYHEIGDADKEGASILGMYRPSVNLHEDKAAAEFLKQALPFYTKPEGKPVRAEMLLELGKYYLFKVGDYNAALEYFKLSYPIYIDINLLREGAIVADTIGALYQALGYSEEAYHYLHEGLKLRAHLGEKCDELEMLSNLGYAALSLGLKAEALRLLRDEAPPLYNTGDSCGAMKPSALNNLGKTYYDLGEFEKARASYLEALKFSDNGGFKAIVHNNLGTVHYAMGEYAKSLESYEQALALYQDDIKAQATTQSNIGVVYAAQGEYQLAIIKFKDALKLRQQAADKNGEAITLTHLSEVYLKSGELRAAEERMNQALMLFGSVNDPSGEAVAFANAMNVWRALGRKQLAIFYGKLSVNRLQALRGAARGIEGELQQNYLRMVKASYQHLAELLIEEGLFEQAIQILSLYQDQQFFDFNFAPDIVARRAYLSARETTLAARYETLSEQLRRLELQSAELKRHLNNRQAGAQETENPKELQAEVAAASEAFVELLKNSAAELARPAGDEDKSTPVDDINRLREALKNLGAVPGQKAVALFTLVGDAKFYVLLLTPRGVQAFSHPTTADVMNNQVRELLTVLSCPNLDPFPESSALYNIIFKSISTEDKRITLAAEVEKYRPDLLLWSLSEPLDSVPMAALYDAAHKQFLIEKYQHAVFTRVQPDRISREPKSWRTGIGLGTSKAYTGYTALPGVKKSLSVIFNDETTGHKGIIDGPALMDDNFKQSTLENLGGKWPLVHIASHFAYYPGNAEDSALLLGDGQKFSFSEMQQHKTLFAEVELLMLSACKTSVSQANIYGKKIDGFAELAQRLGANSVIATLWNISDDATAEQEIGFYRLYRDHQNWAKSEVLRQSQLELLRGRVTRPASAATSSASREESESCAAAAGKPRKRYTPNPKAPLAHPYYWSPFVLYGGSR